MQEKEYVHILNFRCQIHIAPNENNILSETIMVNSDDITYRIFVSEDIICSKFKPHGHDANKYTNSTNKLVKDLSETT